MGEVGLLEYFAAHAPEVPGDFPRLTFDVVQEDSLGRKYLGIDNESECDRIVRWRWHYAREMVKAKGVPNE